MRLTTYTDYALRTLMYLASNCDRLVTIQDIANDHGIAKNHLTKVVHQLSTLGFVESLRGRNGGLRLGLPPEQINIGAVVRSTESDFYMAECFNPGKNHCILSRACVLKEVLVNATSAYLAVLDSSTLADLMKTTGRSTELEMTFKSIPIQLQPTAAKDKQPAPSLKRLKKQV